MEPIYRIVDGKKRGDGATEEPIVRKNQKGFADDASLFPEVIKFLEARLNIGKDPVMWPKFTPPSNAESNDQAKGKKDATTSDVVTHESTINADESGGTSATEKEWAQGAYGPADEAILRFRGV